MFTVLCNHVEAAVNRDHPLGHIKRLLVNMPPSTGKSFFVAVCLAPWTWTWWPECRFLYFSYNLGKATKDSVRARELVRSDWYQNLFGDIVNIPRGSDKMAYYATSRGGERMTSYPGGQATGEHPDVIVIDDPMSADDVHSQAAREEQTTWYSETITSRGIAREASHLIFQQRLHVEDLSGYVTVNDKKRVEAGNKPYFVRVTLPMRFEPDAAMQDIGYGGDWRKEEGELLVPELLTTESVEQLESELSVKGPWAADAQLQQRPSRRDGSIFKMSHVVETTLAMLPSRFDYIYRFWDLAGTEDGGCETAGALIGLVGNPIGGDYYLVDMVAERLDGDGVEALVEAVAKRDWIVWHGANSIMNERHRSFFEREGGSGGKRDAEVKERKWIPWNILQVPPYGDKVSRAGQLATLIKNKKYHIPMDAPWASQTIDDMQQFSANAKRKDRIDAQSGAVLELLNPTHKTFKAVAAGKRKPGELAFGRYGQDGQCKYEGCKRPASDDGRGVCCETCETGRHTPACASRWNTWYVQNSRD